LAGRVAGRRADMFAGPCRVLRQAEEIGAEMVQCRCHIQSARFSVQLPEVTRGRRKFNTGSLSINAFTHVLAPEFRLGAWGHKGCFQRMVPIVMFMQKTDEI